MAFFNRLLGVVLPAVYYGVLPFLLLAWVGILFLWNEGLASIAPHWRWGLAWLAIAAGLLLSGFYTTWMIRQASARPDDEVDRAIE